MLQESEEGSLQVPSEIRDQLFDEKSNIVIIKPGPPPQAIPMMPQGQPAMCCGPYYDGYGGPAFNGYGMPPQPYECYGRPVYESWGGGCPPPPPAYRQCHVTRCDYFSEENPQSCSIM
ncbi:unnamed protein product [Arabidopsis thaliana]|uniref:(thale cress) hypothetical protein n=1 Tax=Arabidopsis thaliana TaxID=3702 RepID=A0A7G2F2Y8_ARATH|nr:unnamed protein product [Arabidopsis thaliana]